MSARGRRGRGSFGRGGRRGSSLVKISVPRSSRRMNDSDTEENLSDKYQEAIFEMQNQKDLTLNEILAVKNLYPFKSAVWKQRTQNKAKGDKVGKSLKQILSKEAAEAHIEGAYTSVEAARSMYPGRKYCDFTGFRAKYTDKKTGLRYYSHSFYSDICKISNTVKNQYLELRNAVINIKQTK